MVIRHYLSPPKMLLSLFLKSHDSCFGPPTPTSMGGPVTAL